MPPPPNLLIATAFDWLHPEWLPLLALLPVVWLVSRRSLAGLGRTRRRLSLGVRFLLTACLVAALAEPRFRWAGDELTVLFVVDRSLSIPPESAGGADARRERVNRFLAESTELRGPAHRNDQAGVILFGRRPQLVLPPHVRDRLALDDRAAGALDGDATDIAAALKLALASFPEGTGKRIVLISDGNENHGRAEEQARLARQQGVEIDVLPLAAGVRAENEVLVQAVEAPSRTSFGTRLPIRVLVRNVHPSRIVEASLELVQQHDRETRPLRISDGPDVIEKTSESGPARIRLRPGLNEFRFVDLAGGQSDDGDVSLTYRATLLPLRSLDADGGNVVAGLPGDRAANNRAGAAVIARGQRRLLFLVESVNEKTPYLVDVLRRAKFRVDVLPASQLPTEPTDCRVFLSGFDCILMANLPVEAFAGAAPLEAIRDAVADQGCGLIVIGGPTSFGAGGYERTAIEEALPVECAISASRDVGRGGLVLILNGSTAPAGTSWQKQAARQAIERLGPKDMVGILSDASGVAWSIPFQDVGDDRQRLFDLLDAVRPAPMPGFDPAIRAAVDVLADPKQALASRHVIVVSDGEPASRIGEPAVARMVAGGVVCTTIGLAKDGPATDRRTRPSADGKSWSFYPVADPTRLPRVSEVESQRIRQSFLYTEPFEPVLRLRDGPMIGMPEKLPRLHGFVRTTPKCSATVEIAIGTPKIEEQTFPILAYWPCGTGRVAAFTSDARSRPDGVRGWDRDWLASGVYDKFWQQLVSATMRSAETGRLTVASEFRDGKVRLFAEIDGESDRPLTDVTLRGKVTRVPPGERLPALEFTRTGPGRYSAEFAASEQGAYFVSVRALRKEQVIDGARTAVTVPYAPEFAEFESNTPLLRRLAALTGGRVYDENDASLRAVAKSGEVFRAAPGVARSPRPVWFWFVFLAAVGLVLDVAVRRVRVPLPEAWKGIRERGRSLRSRGRGPVEAPNDFLNRMRGAKQRARGSDAENEPGA